MIKRAMPVIVPAEAGVPVNPSALVREIIVASGSVPSESSTLGTCLRRDSSVYVCFRCATSAFKSRPPIADCYFLGHRGAPDDESDMPPASEPSRQTGVSLSTIPNSCSAHTGQPAEDGIETVARLIDLAGPSRTVTINVPLFSIDKIAFTDAVEFDQRAGATTRKRGVPKDRQKIQCL